MPKIALTCIIDDDEIFVYAMKKLINLKQLSSEILHFKTVEEAIQYLSAHCTEPELIPDVILLDINLPVLDGWDFIDNYAQIKQNLIKSPRIYMLSSSVSIEDQQRAQKSSDITNYFTKPLSKDAFEEAFTPVDSLNINQEE